MRLPTILASVVCCLASGPVWATKLNAVCRDIGGVRIDDDGTKLVRTADGLVDVVWSYSGNTETGEGTLILQSSKSAGGRVVTEKAFVQRKLSDHWTFVSLLPDATWVHSLYPRTGQLLVTQNSSTYASRLSGKFMTGACTITVN